MLYDSGELRVGKLAAAFLISMVLVLPAAAQNQFTTLPIPTIPVSQLTTAGALTGPELFYVVQGGISKNVTFSGLSASVEASFSNLASGNTFLGTGAYSIANGQPVNIFNAGFGVGVFNSMTNASANSGFGYHALFSYIGNVSTGDSETALGYQALLNDSTGEFNTAVGSNAGKCATIVFGSVFIGHGAGGQDDASPAICSGADNVFVGGWSGQEATTLNGTACVGTNSCLNLTTGTDDVAFGIGALCGGYGCSFDNPGGNPASFDVAIGAFALNSTTQNNLTMVGYAAGEHMTTATFSTGVGVGALTANISDSGNTAIGSFVLGGLNGGSNNTGVGTIALESCTACAGDTAVGENAGQKLTTGLSVTLIGLGAGGALTTENGDIFVGWNAGSTATGFSNSIVIGNSVQPTASNQAIIGPGTITSTILNGVLTDTTMQSGGTAIGSVCITAGGVLFTKTTTGSCV